jgi:hypothetical protein
LKSQNVRKHSRNIKDYHEPKGSIRISIKDGRSGENPTYEK